MPALVSLLGSILPYVIGAIGIVAAYFGIKHKGVTEERARQQVAQAKVQQQVQKQVEVAKSQDAVIDQKVEAQVEAIKKANAPKADTGDTFTF